ncbi:MAG: lipopolysaccharide biosynthesis protein [Gemmatimonadales bacterium]
MTLEAIRMGKRSLVYLAGDLATRLVAFVLVPLYTHFLSPADYGVLGVLASVTAVLSAISLMGLPGTATRYYFEFPDTDRRQSFLRTVWMCAVAAAVVVGLLSFTAGRPVAALLLPGVPFRPLVLLTVWTAALAGLPSIPLAIYRAAERPAAYVGLSVSTFVTTMLLMIALVAGARLGVYGAVLAQFLSTMVMAGVAAWLMWPTMRATLRAGDVRRAVTFGLPLIPHTLATWALNLSDRLILQRYVPLSEIGIYSLGYQFGMIMSMLGAATNNVWTPFFMQRALDRERAPALSAAATRFVAAAAWLTLGVAILSPDAIALMANARYAAATRIAPIIAVGYGLLMLYFLPTNVLFAANRTAALAVCSVGAAAANVALNIWLVPRWGIAAAAFNTAIAFAVELMAVHVVARKVTPFQYEWRRITVILLSAAALAGAGLAIRLEPLAADLALKIVIALSLPAVLWVLRVPDAEERLLATQLTTTAGMWWRERRRRGAPPRDPTR